MSTLQVIQQSLPLVARAVGRKLGVEVIVGGNQASTDLRRIIVPALPTNEPEAALLTLGFLEHEAAHVRYTKAVPKDLVISALHHHVTNILEDVRIERLLIEEYPGFERDLARLVQYAVRAGLFAEPQADWPPVRLMQAYLLYRLRAVVLGQSSVQELARTARAHLEAVLPVGAIVRLGSVAGRVPALKSTLEASELARDVLELIKEELEKAPLSTQNTGGQGGNQGQDSGQSSAQGQGSTDGQDPGQSNVQGQGSTNGQDPGQSSAQDQGSTDGQDSGQSNTQGQANGAGALLASEILASQEGFDGLGEIAAQALRELAGDTPGNERVAIAEAGSAPPSVGDAATATAEVRSASMALGVRLRRYVESTRKSKRRHSRYGVRVNGQRLVASRFGDDRIYTKRTQTHAVNTAVQILLDKSGSMSARMGTARQATLAAAVALNDIPGLRVAVASFPGSQQLITPVTLFGESMRATAGRYAALQACGGTPLLECLYWSYDQLLAQREPRKILLVVTDGDPARPEQCRESILQAWRGGIEVLGLGIHVPSIDRVFPVSSQIDDVGELAGSMFSMLQQTLTHRAA